MTSPADSPAQSAPTKHQELLSWVDEIAQLAKPDKVQWINGSDEEWKEITDALVEAGTFVRLNEEKKPNSFWAASDPSDVARVEDRTYICSEQEVDAVPHLDYDERLDAVLTPQGLIEFGAGRSGDDAAAFSR